jgi:hypothetical protein
LLCASRERRNYQAEQGREDTDTKNGAERHGHYCKWFPPRR